MLPKVTDVEWYASNLPDGLVIDASTGTISGTPVEVGTYEAQMRVRTNYGLSVMEKVALNVTAGNLQITTTSLPVGDIHWEYSYQLQHSGGGTVSWDVIGLPAGMYYETDGRILGAPSEEYADDRTYTIKLVLWGSDGYRKDERELELVVRGMYPHLLAVNSDNMVTASFSCDRTQYASNGSLSSSHWYYRTPSTTTTDSTIFTILHGTTLSEGVSTALVTLSNGTVAASWNVNGAENVGHEGRFYTLSYGITYNYWVQFSEDGADKIRLNITNENNKAYFGTYNTNKPKIYTISGLLMTVYNNWGSCKLKLSFTKTW